MKTCTPRALLVGVLILAAHVTNAPTTATAQTPASHIARTSRERAPRKRVAPLRADDTPGGSRVTVASDVALSDYSAYRSGEEFHVFIPEAVADTEVSGVSGRGFTDARVEPRDGGLLLTFRMEADASAHVKQNFNRLDILFSVSDGDARLMKVLKRVEELEARVRELEAQRAGGEKPEAAAVAASAAADANSETPAHNDGARADVKSNADVRQAEGEHEAGAHAEGRLLGTPRLQIKGFADVNLRASNEKGRTTSFSLGQLDLFITSRLSENFSVLGELILEAEQDNSFNFELHRLLLRYTPREYFNLDVGRTHTSIGYYNTAYHHGSWFQTAASRPFIFAFESKGGILPLHNVGVSVSGRIPRAPLGLRYVAEVGNGRASRSARDRSVQTFVDEDNGKAFNLALVSRPSQVPGLQTGFSVYRDRRTPAGTEPVGETIMAAHLVYKNRRDEFISDGVVVRHAAAGRVFHTPGFYAQYSRRYGKARPYFRYQYVNAPDDDPIFKPLDVGRRDGPAFGLRYDVSEFAAFKVQYERMRRRRKSAFDELIMQLAFTF